MQKTTPIWAWINGPKQVCEQQLLLLQHVWGDLAIFNQKRNEGFPEDFECPDKPQLADFAGLVTAHLLQLMGVQIITLDGPGKSGKGAVSTEAARQLGGVALSTGDYFRWITLHRLRGVATDDIYYPSPKELGQHEAELQSKFVTNSVAEYAQDLEVRLLADLILLQACIEQVFVYGNKVLVVEGRHIGSALFPNAYAKFFLTCSLHIRIMRILPDWENKPDEYNELHLKLTRRDQLDGSREIHPLVKTVDMTTVMNDGPMEATVQQLIAQLPKPEQLVVSI